MAIADNTIIKSQYDDKDYLAFTLANQLEVLVISDNDTDVAAGSLLISAGQRTSPEEHLGLPHLLEHAVFLGSKNYPKLSEYDNFIKSQRGWSNGSTRSDNTRYHFQLTEQALDEGLARLADFIAFPLLTQQSIEKARVAVDNEFHGRTDDWRRTLTILQQESNPNHPSAKFGTGNAKTLAGDLSTLKKALVKFHQQYYGAQNMTLVVYGKGSVEDLKNMVTMHFSHINQSSLSDKQSTEPRHLAKQLASQIELNIQSNTPSLDIRFEVPASNSNFPYNEGAVASYILSHEAKGSLYADLKAQGLITRLQGEVQGNRYYGILAFYLQLTEKGIANKDKVIESLFGYINLLKAQPLPSWISQDIHIANQRTFDFPSEQEPGDWLSDVSYDMQLYPQKNWLNNYTVNTSKTFSRYLAQLTPENMQLVISHNNDNINTDKLEPIYHTPYRVSNFTDEQLTLWANAKPSKSMRYPGKNPYYVEKLANVSNNKGDNKAVSKESSAKYAQQTQPELAINTAGLQLWSQYKNDINVGKISSKLRIYHQKNTTSELVALVHSKALQEHVFDTDYFALVAGFNFAINSFESGYTIEVNGYSDNYFSFLQKITSLFFDFETSERSFNYAKQELLYDIDYRKNYSRPYRQIERALYQTLFEQETDEVISKKLANLSYQDYLANLAANKKFQLAGVITGKVTDEKLRGFTDKLLSKYNKQLSAGLIKTPQVTQLPIAHQVKEISIEHNDANIGIIIQAHDNSIENQANFFLANSILHRKYYHNIRTDTDLAYFVHMRQLSTYHSANLVMVAQSANSSAEQIQQASSKFIEDFDIALNAMSDEAFAEQVETAINTLNDRPFHLNNYTNKLEQVLYSAPEVNNKVNPFSKKQQTITVLKSLTKQKFTHFYQQQIMAKSSKRLTVFSSGKAIAQN